MKISQILIQPIGQRFNAGTLTIKTCKKTWQVKEVWYHQVIFMDDTGEIPADVKIGKYNPFTRGQQVTVIIGAVREAEYLGKPRKILFVDQYSIPTTTMAEYDAQEEGWHLEQQDITKGKIRHGLVCAIIRRNPPGPITLKLNTTQKQEINNLIDFITTGE